MSDAELGPNARPSLKVIHKAVQNYLINDLGMSRAKIMEQIKPLVDTCVRELLGMNYGTEGIGKRWVHDLIRETIRDMVQPVVTEMMQKMLKNNTRITVDIAVPVTSEMLQPHGQRHDPSAT